MCGWPIHHSLPAHVLGGLDQATAVVFLCPVNKEPVGYDLLLHQVCNQCHIKPVYAVYAVLPSELAQFCLVFALMWGAAGMHESALIVANVDGTC